jgi:5-methylcytosine-specific restriction endonuclease McrBC GTP-binding regulatory subunit McrB
MPEGENKSKGKFANAGEENLVYANIIPIKVNQETIYAEVETGKIGKSRPTNIKLTIDDDQLHTTYAEIRHSVIPEDQRR